jgi:hypothetical protein
MRLWGSVHCIWQRSQKLNAMHHIQLWGLHFEVLPVTTTRQSLLSQCLPTAGTGRSAQPQSASRPPLAGPLHRQVCSRSTNPTFHYYILSAEGQDAWQLGCNLAAQGHVVNREKTLPHPWARQRHWCLESRAQCLRTGPRAAAACASSSRSTSSAALAAIMWHTYYEWPLAWSCESDSDEMTLQ